MFMMTCFNKMVRESQSKPSFWTGTYLLLARPVYCLGFSLFIIPMIVKSKLTRPLHNLMSHWWFAPYSRLVFGVFLCNTIFMQFESFNLTSGRWAQRFQVDCFCFAFLTISFGFSFLTYIFIEAPLANVLNDFYRKLKPEVIPEHVHYHSQSAKAPLRRPRRDDETGEQRPRRKRRVKRVVSDTL